jgi:hypothetical protein
MSHHNRAHHGWVLVCSVALGCAALAQETPSAPPVQEDQPAKLERRDRSRRRVPGRRKATQATSILGMVQSRDGIPLGGVKVTLTDLRAGTRIDTESSGDGIFRLRDLPAGNYQISAEAPGYARLVQESVTLTAGELLTVELRLTPSEGPGLPTPRERRTPTVGEGEEPQLPAYRELSRRPEQEVRLPTDEREEQQTTSRPETNRWDIGMPSWERYGDRDGEYPYISGHWYDPFNLNRAKGDKPVIGQSVFFNFTGTSVTALDARRLFVPSGVSAERPLSEEFFGKNAQVFLAQTFRLSFDLFKGDTSFKPIDWRIKITPAVQLNQLWTRERGIVNIDVRKGPDRTDYHVGIQEAFIEKKLADLSPNYDFLSLRVGVQQFNSDFRGLLFLQEQPGARLFGNLRSNRLQYNAAYFWFLEKDTNSGLNAFQNRHQQVAIANFYVQDFITKGYTAQVSYHYNKDDATLHFDQNGFLVRPAPIGAVTPHDIRAHYIGITGNGHFGRFNVSNAVYQVLGYDELNPIAGRRTDINAQMGALEVSIDKDWLRFKASGIYASGDSNPRDRIARGFDAISEAQTFAGGIFSFFNREGIRLTGTGVALVAPDSFLPNLRSSKEEGQVNFVNPGLFLVNAGIDLDVTPKIRAILNANYMRFHHTRPLELLLFQSDIDNTIGVDYSVGMIYRPPLTENIVIVSGITGLTPGKGLRQVYTGKTLVSGFSTVKFQF